MMKKWEYAIVFVKDGVNVLDRKNSLNQMGQEGWELVSSAPVINSLKDTGIEYQFKRLITPTAEEAAKSTIETIKHFGNIEKIVGDSKEQ